MNLSANFTLEELTHSDIAVRRGIGNDPSPIVVANLQKVAEGLEQIRRLLNSPIIVHSGYRSPAVNTAIGGAQGSAHVEGLAADFIAPRYGSPMSVARAISDSGIVFDQLIAEGTWVHVSFDPRRRREVLTANFLMGGVSYSKGLA